MLRQQNSTELFCPLELIAFAPVPRISPIAKRDIEIAARFRAFRKSQKCSRSYLATKSGTDAQTIVRIELGRVPLKYGIAKQLLWALGCSPAWLATGKGDQKLYVPLPDATAIDEADDTAFSDVFDRRLATYFSRKTESECMTGSEPEIRSASAFLLHDLVDDWLCEVPDGHVQELTREIQSSVHRLLNKWPADSAEVRFARRVWFNLLASREGTNKSAQVKKTVLTNPSESFKVGGEVKIAPQWPALKKKLQEATEAIGAKPALAKVLGVDSTQISQWLSDSKSAREPGGDYALRMQAWLNDPKR